MMRVIKSLVRAPACLDSRLAPPFPPLAESARFHLVSLSRSTDLCPPLLDTPYSFCSSLSLISGFAIAPFIFLDQSVVFERKSRGPANAERIPNAEIREKWTARRSARYQGTA